MKVRFLIFVFIVVPVFLTTCSTLETNEAPANPDWEDVEATYNSLESEQNFVEIESYSKELSAFKLPSSRSPSDRNIAQFKHPS